MKKLILIGLEKYCKFCMNVVENEKKYKIVSIIGKKKEKTNII